MSTPPANNTPISPIARVNTSYQTPPPIQRRRRNAVQLTNPGSLSPALPFGTRDLDRDSSGSPPPLRERVERILRQRSSQINGTPTETPTPNVNARANMTPFTTTRPARRRRVLFDDEMIPMKLQSASFEKEESRSKTPIATPTESPTQVHVSCVNQLEGLHPEFKAFSRKFKRICTSLSEECVNFDQQKQALLDTFDRTASQLPESYRSYTNVDPDFVIASVFRRWLSLNELARKRLLVVEFKDLYVTYSGQQGIGEGVTRSFVQKLLDELSAYDILAPYQDGASQRYFISPTFKPTDGFQRASGFPFKTESEYTLFYEFIGHLLMFIVCNDIGLPIHLSHAILAHMIYKHEEIDADDYLGYYLMDFPDEAIGILNLMREKDIQTIDMVGIEFNDEFDLVNENTEVTSENYITYLQMRAQHRETHFIHPRDNRPKNAVDTYQRFLGLSKGFQYMRKLLRSQRITIPVLDKLITYSAMNAETVKALAQRYKQVMEERFRDTNVPRNDIQRKAFQHMLRIFQDNGDRFPYEEIGISVPPSDPQERQQIFFTFIEKLLLFWSSLRYFNSEFAYITVVVNSERFESSIRTMQRNNRDYLTPQEQENILPESHTCYTRIDIPSSYADDPVKLYKKLVIATYNVESGIGNLGGGRKPRKPRSNTSKKTTSKK